MDDHRNGSLHTGGEPDILWLHYIFFIYLFFFNILMQYNMVLNILASVIEASAAVNRIFTHRNTPTRSANC